MASSCWLRQHNRSIATVPRINREENGGLGLRVPGRALLGPGSRFEAAWR